MIALHIGLKKSGSASIQSFLVANEGALARVGVDYPRTGRGAVKDHHNLAAEIMGRRKFNSEHGSLEDLANRWNPPSAGVHLLSSEMFEECNPREIAKIKAAFDRDHEGYRIILYIRDLAAIMPSSYAQKIKNGGHAYDFDTFFEARMAERRTNYFLTAERWAAVFGWEAVRVRVLDSAHLVNGDLIDDFLAVLGFDPDAPEMRALERPGVVNVAPGWRVLEAIRGFLRDRHGLGPDHPLTKIQKSHPDAKVIKLSIHRKLFARATMQAGDELGWNRDRGLYLTAEQAAACTEVYGQTIRQFNAVLETPLPPPCGDPAAHGFRERPWAPDVDRIDPVELRAFYDRVGKILLKRGLMIG